ncbi:hypothetical protein BC940DRAFT_53562 [Gongronella butleri]|nr:hypothetical protein BC940DRAFT_53562 [Gongronella butleri]
MVAAKTQVQHDPPLLSYDTILKNISNSNGNDALVDIDKFMKDEQLDLDVPPGKKSTPNSYSPFFFLTFHLCVLVESTLPAANSAIDLAALLQKLEEQQDCSQECRQLIQHYLVTLDNMKNLESQTSSSVKQIEHAQMSLENTIRTIEQQLEDQLSSVNKCLAK